MMNKKHKFLSLFAALCLSQFSHAQITIKGGSPTVGFLGSNKAQVTTTHNGSTQVSYNATDVDKLVVVYAAESGFNAQSVNSLTMQFNGVPMTLARFQQSFPSPIPNDNGAVAIFYLDNPFQGSATFTAGFSATAGGANGGFVSIYGLQGTAPGIGAVAGTTHVDVVSGNQVGTSITTTGPDSLVIAGIQVSGQNNVSGSIPSAVTPLTLGNSASWGSNWAHGASGYRTVADGGTTITPTFTSGTSKFVDVAAVEFTVPVPTLYWDVNGDTAGAGNPADGVWDAALTNWNPLADGTGVVATWAPGQKAVFSAGNDAISSYTVTVDGSQNTSGISFENGLPILANGTGGALNLTDDSIFNVLPSVSALIETPVTQGSADLSLTKVGSGTLEISGNLAHTGATTMAEGKLVLTGNNATATGGMVLGAGLTEFGSLASMNGTGENIALNSAATLMFGGSFGEANLPAALDRIVATSAGVIAADNYEASSFNFDAAALEAAFFGAVNNVDYIGTLTPQDVTYRLGGGGGSLTMANANAITGSGKALIAKGNVTLAEANDYDGGTTLLSGQLALGDNGALGTGALVMNGGQLSSNSTIARTIANPLTINTGITLGDAVRNGKLTFSDTVNLGGAVRTLGLVSDVEFSGVVSNGGITKVGESTLTLSGNNTYTGATTHSAGTLVLSGSSSTSSFTLLGNTAVLVIENAAGLGAGTFNLNAHVSIQAVGTITLSNAISWQQTLNVAGTGSLTLGTMTTNGNRIMNNNNTTNPTTISAITGSNHTLTFNGSGNTIISGNITTGTGTLTKNNAGTLTLQGSNTYSGNTTVAGGTLSLVGGSQNSAITVNNTATLAFILGSPTTSSKAVTLNAGHKIAIIGTPTLSSYTLMTASSFIGTPVLAEPIPGYELELDGGTLKLVGQAGGYLTWAAINAIDSAANLDKDGDGVSNAVEYVLGGDVNTNDLGKLPTVNASGANLVFSFKRDRDSIDGSTTVQIEVGNDLTGWPSVFNVGTTTGNSSAGVTVTENSPEGFDTITLTVEKGADTKKFGRLKVTVTE
jgi:autotransporter-associated beta strand protein